MVTASTVRIRNATAEVPRAAAMAGAMLACRPGPTQLMASGGKGIFGFTLHLRC